MCIYIYRERDMHMFGFDIASIFRVRNPFWTALVACVSVSVSIAGHSISMIIAKRLYVYVHIYIYVYIHTYIHNNTNDANNNK